MYMDELEYGEEIRGKKCPDCGGSVIRLKEKAFCDECGFVKPVADEGGKGWRVIGSGS